MPSRVFSRENAWYVLIQDAEGGEHPIPCLLFGEATRERLDLMKRIVNSIIEETRRKAPKVKPFVPKPCSKCAVKAKKADDSMATMGAAIVEAVRLATAAQAPAPAPAPAPGPTPQETCEKFLAWLADRVKEGRNTKQTLDLRRSMLNRLLRDLGGESWEKWKRFDIHLNEQRTDLTSTSKGKYIDAVSVLIRWALRREMDIPDVRISRREIDVDKRVDARQRRPGSAWTLKQARAILTMALSPETPLWLRLMVHICAFAGFAPADAKNLLSGRGTFRNVDGVWWYTASRQKSISAISVPVADTLVRLLRPLMENECVIRLDGIPRNPERRRDAFVELCERAGVECLAGQVFKRWRTFFHTVLHSKWNLDRSFRLRLMGYSGADRSEGSLSNYDDFPPEDLLEAMRKYDAYLSGGEAATAVA